VVQNSLYLDHKDERHNATLAEDKNMTNAQFHERYAKTTMYTDYDGHRIYYVAKNGRAIIVRDGQIVDWVKAGSMPRTLFNARVLVDDHNLARWDAKVSEDEDRFLESYEAQRNAPNPYIGY
jgi:hypothetical protein